MKVEESKESRGIDAGYRGVVCKRSNQRRSISNGSEGRKTRCARRVEAETQDVPGENDAGERVGRREREDLESRSSVEGLTDRQEPAEEGEGRETSDW